jgi:hypothetical protein
MNLNRKLFLAGAVALLFTGVMASGAGAATNPNFGGSANSTLNRSNASGQGNFGQCHALGFVDPSNSSQLNPSATSPGAASCRKAGGLEAAAVLTGCTVGQPVADATLTFQPTRSASATSGC